MALKESGEMYLESIYIISKEKGSVRSIDVAEHMNFSKPSVSRGVGLLKSQKYITVDDNGYIFLTKEGERLAQKVFERHTVLQTVLESLGVDKASAAQDACRIEHVISDNTFNAIKKHYEMMKK